MLSGKKLQRYVKLITTLVKQLRIDLKAELQKKFNFGFRE